MLYNLTITPRQLKSLAAWACYEEFAAPVWLREHDGVLVARQGDDGTAWEQNGWPPSEAATEEARRWHNTLVRLCEAFGVEEIDLEPHRYAAVAERLHNTGAGGCC